MPETLHEEESRSKRVRKLSHKGTQYNASKSKSDKPSSRKASKKRTSSKKPNAQQQKISDPIASTTILTNSDPMKLDGEATLSIEWKTTTSGKLKAQKAKISGKRKLEIPVDEPKKTKQRKGSIKKKDLSWTPGCESTKQSTGSLSHMMGDASTEVDDGNPIVTSVLFNRDALKIKIPSRDPESIYSAIGKEFQKKISEENKKGQKILPFHEHCQRVLECSATGSPIAIETIYGTHLTRRTNTKLMSVYTNQKNPPATPQVTSFSKDHPFHQSAEHNAVGPNPYKKVQQKIKITRALLADARKKIKDLPKRNQNTLVGASATKYFEAAGMHPPRDDDSKEHKGHWCHAILYAALHILSQFLDNLGCGTDAANALCTVWEALLPLIAKDYPEEGLDFTVIFEFVDGTRHLTDIKFIFETEDYEKHIAFNAQDWTRPHVSTWPYAERFFRATHAVFTRLKNTGKLPEVDPLEDGDAIMFYPAPTEAAIPHAAPKATEIPHDKDPFAIDSSPMLATPSTLPAAQVLPKVEPLIPTPMRVDGHTAASSTDSSTSSARLIKATQALPTGNEDPFYIPTSIQAYEHTAVVNAVEDFVPPQTLAEQNALFTISANPAPLSAADYYEPESRPLSVSTFSCLGQPPQALTPLSMQVDGGTATPAAAGNTAPPQTTPAQRDISLSSTESSGLSLSMPADYEYDPPLPSESQEASPSLSASQELEPLAGLTIASPQMPAFSLAGNPLGFFKFPTTTPKVSEVAAALSLTPFKL